MHLVKPGFTRQEMISYMTNRKEARVGKYAQINKGEQLSQIEGPGMESHIEDARPYPVGVPSSRDLTTVLAKGAAWIPGESTGRIRIRP